MPGPANGSRAGVISLNRRWVRSTACRAPRPATSAETGKTCPAPCFKRWGQRQGAATTGGWRQTCVKLSCAALLVLLLVLARFLSALPSLQVACRSRRRRSRSASLRSNPGSQTVVASTNCSRPRRSRWAPAPAAPRHLTRSTQQHNTLPALAFRHLSCAPFWLRAKPSTCDLYGQKKPGN